MLSKFKNLAVISVTLLCLSPQAWSATTVARPYDSTHTTQPPGAGTALVQPRSTANIVSTTIFPYEMAKGTSLFVIGKKFDSTYRWPNFHGGDEIYGDNDPGALPAAIPPVSSNYSFADKTSAFTNFSDRFNSNFRSPTPNPAPPFNLRTTRQLLATINANACPSNLVTQVQGTVTKVSNVFFYAVAADFNKKLGSVGCGHEICLFLNREPVSTANNGSLGDLKYCRTESTTNEGSQIYDSGDYSCTFNPNSEITVSGTIPNDKFTLVNNSPTQGKSQLYLNNPSDIIVNVGLTDPSKASYRSLLLEVEINWEINCEKPNIIVPGS